MICFRHLAVVGVGCASIVVASVALIADEKPRAAEKEAAVRQAGKTYVEALRRGDGKALAALWTVDGVYVDATGRSVKAQELIEQSFGSDATTQTKDDVTVDPNSSIRFVTPNVAIEEGTSSATAAGSADGAAGHYTAIWVNHGQGWQLASLRELGIRSDSSRLDALAWMIGDWVGKGDDLIVRSSAYWSENKKFIVRRFTVEQAGTKVLGATQRIGWDPAAGKIRSWVFDSEGGITEGRWRSEGDSWIVKTTGVLPNGSQSSAINFWIPEGEDRSVLKSSHVMVDDVAIEDSVIEFNRIHSR